MHRGIHQKTTANWARNPLGSIMVASLLPVAWTKTNSVNGYVSFFKFFPYFIGIIIIMTKWLYPDCPSPIRLFLDKEMDRYSITVNKGLRKRRETGRLRSVLAKPCEGQESRNGWSVFKQKTEWISLRNLYVKDQDDPSYRPHKGVTTMDPSRGSSLRPKMYAEIHKPY